MAVITTCTVESNFSRNIALGLCCFEEQVLTRFSYKPLMHQSPSLTQKEARVWSLFFLRI